MNYIEIQHQRSWHTENNRYPDIFNLCRDYWNKLEQENLNILSFGCSTGEECFNLLRYFPLSNITGVDINKVSIDKCNKKNVYKNLSFMYSNYENIKFKSPFDIIFCMSVLCRYGVGNDDYKFSEFNGVLQELDNLISKNGLLVIYNSNFRFSDSDIYHKYNPLNSYRIKESGFVPKFDKNNNKLNNDLCNYKYCVFTKIKE